MALGIPQSETMTQGVNMRKDGVWGGGVTRDWFGRFKCAIYTADSVVLALLEDLEAKPETA